MAETISNKARESEEIDKRTDVYEKPTVEVLPLDQVVRAFGASANDCIGGSNPCEG
jgi:hypothetical protein